MLEYLLLLRFGTLNPDHASPPVLNYAAIAKVVRKPLQTVRRLIGHAVKSLSENRVISPVSRFKLKE